MTTTTLENPAQLIELEHVIEETNGLAVTDSALYEISTILRPIAEAMPEAITFANGCKVTNQAEANAAADRREQIVAMFKTSETAIRDFDDGLMNRIYKMHKRWTAFIGLFTPLDDAQKKIKRAIITWQEEEERKARAEERRLQSEADERARKEQDKLLKQAEALKTPEKQEERREQAASIVAPVITVARPVAAVKSQKRWKVKALDMTAMGIPEAIQGYITVEVSRLERAKAANTMLNVPGVEFHQIAV